MRYASKATTRHAMRAFVLALTMTIAAAPAFAQGCDPYRDPDSQVCRANKPAPSSPQCMDPYSSGVICSVAGAYVTSTTFKFGEGVVHAPGSELAWLTLTNFDTVEQTAFVEFLTGAGQRIKRSVTLAAKERKDLSLHAFPELAGLVTFSTGVYFPLPTGHASLVMRPQTDMWTRVTLPPPTVAAVQP